MIAQREAIPILNALTRHRHASTTSYRTVLQARKGHVHHRRFDVPRPACISQRRNAAKSRWSFRNSRQGTWATRLIAAIGGCYVLQEAYLLAIT